MRDPDLVHPLESACVCHFKIVYFSDGLTVVLDVVLGLLHNNMLGNGSVFIFNWKWGRESFF